MAGDERLERTLASVAELASDCRDPWWIIGSAAALLVGVAEQPVADVDLLVSEADARRLLDRLSLRPFSPDPSDRFRSALFARLDALPLPLEVMAGLKVRAHGRWRPVVPRTRQCAARENRLLYVPDAAEQVRICRLFGRAKDLARAARLDELTRASLN